MSIEILLSDEPFLQARDRCRKQEQQQQKQSSSSTTITEITDSAADAIAADAGDTGADDADDHHSEEVIMENEDSADESVDVDDDGSLVLVEEAQRIDSLRITSTAGRSIPVSEDSRSKSPPPPMQTSESKAEVNNNSARSGKKKRSLVSRDDALLNAGSEDGFGSSTESKFGSSATELEPQQTGITTSKNSSSSCKPKKHCFSESTSEHFGSTSSKSKQNKHSDSSLSSALVLYSGPSSSTGSGALVPHSSSNSSSGSLAKSNHKSHSSSAHSFNPNSTLPFPSFLVPPFFLPNPMANPNSNHHHHSHHSSHIKHLNNDTNNNNISSQALTAFEKAQAMANFEGCGKGGSNSSSFNSLGSAVPPCAFFGAMLPMPFAGCYPLAPAGAAAGPATVPTPGSTASSLATPTPEQQQQFLAAAASLYFYQQQQFAAHYAAATQQWSAHLAANAPSSSSSTTSSSSAHSNSHSHSNTTSSSAVQRGRVPLTPTHPGAFAGAHSPHSVLAAAAAAAAMGLSPTALNGSQLNGGGLDGSGHPHGPLVNGGSQNGLQTSANGASSSSLNSSGGSGSAVNGGSNGHGGGGHGGHSHGHSSSSVPSYNLSSYVQLLLRAEPYPERIAQFVAQTSTSGMMPVDTVCEFAARILFSAVQWSRNIPHFPELAIQDQVALMRAVWSELFILNASQYSMPLNAVSLLAAHM